MGEAFVLEITMTDSISSGAAVRFGKVSAGWGKGVRRSIVVLFLEASCCSVNPYFGGAVPMMMTDATSRYGET